MSKLKYHFHQIEYERKKKFSQVDISQLMLKTDRLNSSGPWDKSLIFLLLWEH